jgi:hypothetical protein
MLQIRRDADFDGHERADPGDGQRRMQTRLQIEMREINSYRGKPGDHATGATGIPRRGNPLLPGFHRGFPNSSVGFSLRGFGFRVAQTSPVRFWFERSDTTPSPGRPVLLT